MTFGERLKMLRKEHGMTLEDVAGAVGIGRATVYKYENGMIANVPPARVHALAQLFGVTRPYLMGWTGEREINPAENLDMVAVKMRDVTRQGYHADGASGVVLSGSDCVTAATQAMRALIKFDVQRTPVYPQQIIQHSGITTLISYEKPEELSMDDEFAFRAENQLVMSAALERPDAYGGTHFLFAYNRNASIGDLRYALAVELGHVYLGHGYGTQGTAHNPDVREKEATCFAIHLLFPRPVIQLLEERGFVFTRESFERVFGDCEGCIGHMMQAEPIHVSPELNRIVKDQFARYVNMLDEMGVLKMKTRKSEEKVDLGKYMAGYEE